MAFLRRKESRCLNWARFFESVNPHDQIVVSLSPTNNFQRVTFTAVATCEASKTLEVETRSALHALPPFRALLIVFLFSGHSSSSGSGEDQK